MGHNSAATLSILYSKTLRARLSRYVDTYISVPGMFVPDIYKLNQQVLIQIQGCRVTAIDPRPTPAIPAGLGN
jgi:hypothetical protein